MKKILKWLGIALGSILILLIAAIIYLLVSHDRYGIYPSGGLLSENQAGYDVSFYDINLEVNSDEQSINGYTTIKIKSLVENLDRVEFDLIDNFDVSAVSIDKNFAVQYEHDDDKLLVTLEKPLSFGAYLDIKIAYSGNPIEAIRPPWVGGFNWSTDSTGSDWIGLSCQGEGAKIWFPCKDHPSDEPDSAAINITIPEPYYCASNGVLREVTKPKPGFFTYHWFTGYPINNYNINISIGLYDIIEKEYLTEDGRVMPVYFYVLPQSRKGAEAHLEMAIDMLYTYRKFYGEYPFSKEKFAIVQTDYLGMEHQTINAYGDNYQYRTINGKSFDWLMLHEMGHEWWGNKVTAKDWADMWIQEGICTYGEALYQLDKNGIEYYHQYMAEIKQRIRNRNPIIPKRDATSAEVYSGDIYAKGAYLMHTMRYVLGDSSFLKMLMQFANDSAYTYQNLVTTDDFINHVHTHYTGDVKRFIWDFLYTTVLPDMRVDSVAVDRYELRIPNIHYQLPVEVDIDGEIQDLLIGPKPKAVIAGKRPVIDPRNWYLKKNFRK